MTDALEKVLRPVVEGQVRSFVNDHPEVVGAVTWFKPRPDKTLTFVNSVSKRILRDLLCAETRVRLMAASGAQPVSVSSDAFLLHTSGSAQGEVALPLPRPEYPSARVHRRKVQSVAAAMREELGLPPSPALSPDRSHRRAQIRGRG